MLDWSYGHNDLENSAHLKLKILHIPKGKIQRELIGAKHSTVFQLSYHCNEMLLSQTGFPQFDILLPLFLGN